MHHLLLPLPPGMGEHAGGRADEVGPAPLLLGASAGTP
jgi:hypothetical protein